MHVEHDLSTLSVEGTGATVLSSFRDIVTFGRIFAQDFPPVVLYLPHAHTSGWVPAACTVLYASTLVTLPPSTIYMTRFLVDGLSKTPHPPQVDIFHSLGCCALSVSEVAGSCCLYYPNLVQLIKMN